MNYLIKLIEVNEGLKLYAPDPALVQQTYKDLLSKDDTILFPFWAQVWPSAHAMASFLLEEKEWIYRKRCLELGAGIGLPSFSIAQYADTIMVSDYALEAVELMEKNIQWLQLENAKALCLDWNNLPEEMQVDTLLLSDINYAPDQFEPVLFMISKFLAQGTIIILATPQRITVTPFAEAIQPFIKRSILKTVQHLTQSVEIRIVVLQQG